ncbi:hypothetical protein JL722_6173 [Aureococcus anophagefferens]|nr:hypothetical protein JL722_6173 [Aureococcus anophagefferens]
MGAGASSAQQVVQEASDTQALEALTALYLQDASRAAMLVESAKSAALEQKESGAAPEATPEASKRDWDAFRAELCAEHNLARAKPLEYAETREGAAPVEDLLQALAAHEPCGALTLEAGLSGAAQRHAADLGYSGGMDHGGTDGSTVQTRIEAYGEWWGSCGENISLGFSGARNIVLWLLVDDGVPGRGHRKNILDAKFNVMGCSELREHVKLRQCIVFDYATGFGPKKNVIAVALQAEARAGNDRSGETSNLSISAEAQGEMNANVSAILDSLPHGLEQLKEEITTLLVPDAPGHPKVIIDYKPGSVEAKYITVADGKRSTRTRKATWATESQ